MKDINTPMLNIIASKSRTDNAKDTLQEINLNREVNQTEINKLKFWANAYKAFISSNPFKEFMEA